MMDPNNVDRRILALAIAHANYLLNLEPGDYQLALGIEVVRGNATPAEQRWADAVRAYYNGACMGERIAQQQQATTETAVTVAAKEMCKAFNAYTGPVEGPGAGDCVKAHRALCVTLGIEFR